MRSASRANEWCDSCVADAMSAPRGGSWSRCPSPPNPFLALGRPGLRYDADCDIDRRITGVTYASLCVRFLVNRAWRECVRGYAVDTAFAEFGTVDVIVTNAGYAVFAAVEELSDQQIQRVIDTPACDSKTRPAFGSAACRRRPGARAAALTSASSEPGVPSAPR